LHVIVNFILLFCEAYTFERQEMKVKNTKITAVWGVFFRSKGVTPEHWECLDQRVRDQQKEKSG
jgi:hypothetical protein